MTSTRPNFREAGVGSPVVCIHASLSSSVQWRALTERVADRFRVIAVDLYGAGETAPWPANGLMHLDHQISLLRAAFDAAGNRFHLVGHSSGGAVALKAALMNRSRIASLTLFEPALFSIVLGNEHETAAAHEILGVRDDVVRLVDAGDLDGAARRFVDYWGGRGAWAAIPEDRRPALTEGMRTVRAEWHALLCEPTPLRAFASFNVPTLLMIGTASPASTRAVARLLTSVLPRVHTERIEGAGHMAPITHPDRINGSIERFLATCDALPRVERRRPDGAGQNATSQVVGVPGA